MHNIDIVQTMTPAYFVPRINVHIHIQLRLFLEVEKCKPNPCHNNATCMNDRIRIKCICPPATELETLTVGSLCNESKVLHHTFTTMNYVNVQKANSRHGYQVTGPSSWPQVPQIVPKVV